MNVIIPVACAYRPPPPALVCHAGGHCGQHMGDRSGTTAGPSWQLVQMRGSYEQTGLHGGGWRGKDVGGGSVPTQTHHLLGGGQVLPACCLPVFFRFVLVGRCRCCEAVCALCRARLGPPARPRRCLLYRRRRGDGRGWRRVGGGEGGGEKPPPYAGALPTPTPPASSLPTGCAAPACPSGVPARHRHPRQRAHRPPPPPPLPVGATTAGPRQPRWRRVTRRCRAVGAPAAGGRDTDAGGVAAAAASPPPAKRAPSSPLCHRAPPPELGRPLPRRQRKNTRRHPRGPARRARPPAHPHPVGSRRTAAAGKGLPHD